MNDVRLVATNPADSSLVPVATNARGELAVQSPKIEKVPNSLQVEGDLTVGEGIELKANGGSASFSGGSITLDAYGNINGVNHYANQTLSTNATFSGALNGTNTFVVKADGSASFSGDVSMRANLLIKGGNGSGLFIRDKEDTEYMIDLNENGSAHFLGDVVVGSRSKQWMLVEQGGLCHMVEQARATAADLVTPPVYPKLRDVFAELDVVEKALEQVMEKLRMVEPDGWPVWDGSEV